MIDLPATYAKHARRFAATRKGSRQELPYLEKVSALFDTPGTVLDLGCGSGEPIARYFIERGHRVTGVDVVPEMLEACRAQFPDAMWHHADMRRIDLAQRFDTLIAWDSFFHLSPDDQRAMFDTFRRHTAPGGVLLFTSGTTEGEAVGGELFGDTLYHASLDTAEYRQLLELHGYAVLLHTVEDPDCGGHTVWLARLASDSA